MGRKRGSQAQSGLTADSFSKFFIDKVNDVRASTAGSADPDFTAFHGHPMDEFIPLSVAYVVRLVRDSPTKACGLDPVPTWLVKDFVQLLAPYLTNLFNRSMSEGYFPEMFRLAEVTPILKKSTLDPSVLSSYRPISNLPFVSKVLERAVNEWMSQHLQSNGLLPENQSAYRRSHSTETALLKVTSDALIAADQGKLTLLGMLDLSAAFDCVDHGILLDRLETSFGFSGVVLDWMRSYLVGRRQYVRYNGSTSSVTVMQCGVPQGSVLGPLFFVLYTADAFRIAGELGFHVHGYADDLQIYDHCLGQWNAPAHQSTHSLHRDRGPLDVKQPPEAESIEDGIHLAGFNTSSGKMHLRSNHHRRGNYTTIANGSWSRERILIRPLVSPSTSPGWWGRVTSTSANSGRSVGRSPLSPRTPWWGRWSWHASTTVTDFLAEHRSVSSARYLASYGLPHDWFCCSPRTSSVADRIRTELHWLDIPCRVTFKLCVLAYRCLHGSAPAYLVRYIVPVSAIAGRSHLRSAALGLLSVPRTNTSTIGPRAFAISSPTAWNCLPVDLRDPGHSLQTFRRKLKTHLFNLSSF